MHNVFGNSASAIRIGAINLNVFQSGNQGYISIPSVNKSFLNADSTGWITNFVTYLSGNLTIPIDLIDCLTRPIVLNFNEDGLKKHVLAIDIKTFLQSCFYIKAAGDAGFLFASEMQYAETAKEILAFDEKYNLTEVIQYASGEQLFKYNHKQAILDYLQHELKKSFLIWIKSFPDEFIEILLKMHGQEWTDLNHRPQSLSLAMLSHVFARLDPKVLTELSNTRPKMKYGNQYSLTKYIPHPELSRHLLTLGNIAKIAEFNPTIFSQLTDKMLPIESPAIIKPLKRKENPIPTEALEIAALVKKALQSTK